MRAKARKIPTHSLRFRLAVGKKTGLNHQPSSHNMWQRLKIILLLAATTGIFVLVPIAVLAPIMTLLDPMFLKRLDTVALSLARQVPAGIFRGLDEMVSQVDGEESSNDSRGDINFEVGNVFKHKVFRYTGAIVSMLSKQEREKHNLERFDRWYSALVDSRYKRDNQDLIFVAESQIERMYPGSKDGFKHPRRDEFFREFDPETSSFLSRKQGRSKKKRSKKPARKRKPKSKAKGKRKRQSSDL